MINTKIACDNCHREMTDGYSVSMELLDGLCRMAVAPGIDPYHVKAELHFCGKRCAIEHFNSLLDWIKERRTAA